MHPGFRFFATQNPASYAGAAVRGAPRTPAEAWCAAAGGPAPRELRFAIGAHAVDCDACLSAAELACAQRVGLRVSVAACGGGGRVSAEAGSGRRTLITGAARVADHQHAPAAPPPAAAAEVPTAAPTPPAAAAHGAPEGSQRGSHSVESPSDARTESEPAESEPDAAKSEPAEARGSIMVRRPSTLLAEPLLGARQGPQIEVVKPAELSTACLELVARLNECASARAVKLTLLHGSFSGAKVLLMAPTRRDGRILPTSVLKVDKRLELEKEIKLTKIHGPRWGSTHPQILDVKVGEEWGVMQLELCGGRFGVPGYTRGDAVITLETFLKAFLAGNHPVSKMQQVVRQVAAKLVKWSDAQEAQASWTSFGNTR